MKATINCSCNPELNTICHMVTTDLDLDVHEINMQHIMNIMNINGERSTLLSAELAAKPSC